MTALLTLWILVNALAHLPGASAWDRPPFGWLQGGLALMALYVTLFILTTQRHDVELADHRQQLTLEQKSAKIIALLEEMRRDSPHLRNRLDEDAAARAIAADPQAVLDAIKEGEAIATSVEAPPAGDEVTGPRGRSLAYGLNRFELVPAASGVGERRTTPRSGGAPNEAEAIWTLDRAVDLGNGQWIPHLHAVRSVWVA